ncbi:MAG: DUF3187 family protein [Pseudomonadota bacterium]
MRKAIHKTQSRIVELAIAVLVFVGMSTASAQSLFDAHANMSPISALFLLDSDGIAPGDGLSLHLQTASHSAREDTTNASILFDGESSRARLEWRHQWNERWSFGAGVSQWWHTGGTLDGFIDDWHATFGLPDGIRDTVAKDQLQFLYTEGGEQRLDFTRSRQGIGDVTLSAQRRLGSEGVWALAGHIKLPTGSIRNLSGSGAVDFGLNLLWQEPIADTSGWSWRGGVGVVALGESDLALVDQSGLTWVAHGEVRYRLNRRVDLGGRIEGHGALTDSNLEILGSPALWLVTGGEIRLNPQWRLHISVTEDIKVESAPDVTFNLGLQHKF